MMPPDATSQATAPPAGQRTFGAQARLERLITQLSTAINARALYGPSHPQTEAVVSRILEAVEVACDDQRQDSVTFLLLGDQLVVDERPLQKGGLHQQPVIRAFQRRGIERLTLAFGLDATECSQLVDALAAGGVPAQSPHVVVGQIEVVGAERQEDVSAPTLEELLGPGRIEDGMEAFVTFRADRRAGLTKLADLVWGLIDAMSQSTRSILRVGPLKGHDEYTFVHSVNVSLLVLAQARSFGVEGTLLHNVGLAGLLHDVGKMAIPLAVLNKPGRLDGEEWRMMTMHPEWGAWELAALEGSPPLATLVAYEHHLRFDGRPSYPVLRTPRRPVLASQLTAIADVYDAICTARPYRKALTQRAALDVLRERAGTFHDPFLVGNFFRLLGVG